MEAAEDQGTRLLDEIRPPRLEDAGLEDCALPPDAINEAFLKALAILSSNDEDQDDECVRESLQTDDDNAEVAVGIRPEFEYPGSFASEKCREVKEGRDEHELQDLETHEKAKIGCVKDVEEEKGGQN